MEIVPAVIKNPIRIGRAEIEKIERLSKKVSFIVFV